MQTVENPEQLAERLNAALHAGHAVLMRTYAKATIYKPRSAGAFFAQDGRLYVRRGHHVDDCTTAQFHISK